MGVYKPKKLNSDGSLEDIKFPLDSLDGSEDLNFVEVEISDTVSEAGTNVVTGKGVYNAINNAVNNKQDTLNSNQLAAVNSGITSDLVSKFNNKQDALNEAQLNAVNSGITSDLVTTFNGKQDKITENNKLDFSLIDNVPTNHVTTDTEQTITGYKTFDAPANIGNTEQFTTKFKTSNGGSVSFGKEAANSGTMMRLDQVDGTCRLRFRCSATAGAIVWEQPEDGAKLYFDLGNGNSKHRITMPSKQGTLALKSDIIKTESSTINGNIKINGTETQVYRLPGVATDNNYTNADKAAVDSIGDLETLSTINKNSLVGAINEVKNSSGGGLEEVVLFDRANNNGSGINLTSKNYINLADYGLVGDLKDYKYINLVIANSNGAMTFQISHLARIDQEMLSGNLGSSYTEYPIAVPYYYPLDSTTSFVVGEHSILLNKLNKIILKESRYLQGTSSKLTTGQSTSSILIFKISLLK